MKTYNKILTATLAITLCAANIPSTTFGMERKHGRDGGNKKSIFGFLFNLLGKKHDRAAQEDQGRKQARMEQETPTPSPSLLEQLPDEILQLVKHHLVTSDDKPATVLSARNALKQLITLRLINKRFSCCIHLPPPLEARLRDQENPYKLNLNDDAVTVAAACGQFDRHAITRHLHFGPMGSAAHYAAYYNQLEAFAALVTANPRYLDVMDGNNKTALHIAVEKGHKDVVIARIALAIEETKQKNDAIDARDPQKKQKESAANEKVWHLQILQEIADAGNFTDPALQSFLFKPTIPENQKDANGNTPLIQAAQIGNLAEVQRLLAIPGININAQNRCGQNALHCAAIFGNFPIVQALLANPRITRATVKSALIFAQAQQASRKIIKLLQEYLERHPEA